jgi:predicted O-methyltransferase YrrM
MNLKPTQKSLDLVALIATNVSTFHHHYHILLDIADTFGEKKINYVEIGAYAGGSSCLMLQRLNTTIVSIDLGEPIPKGVVFENIINYKNNNNYYKYIQGNSQIIETKNEVIGALNNSRVLGYSNKIDLLFIDGDHSFDGVIADFNMYSDLVAVGGFVVFDDYNDSVYSPEVKQAVDALLPTLVDYEVIGTFKNELGAYPSELLEGNCFVIKRIK